MARGWRAAVAAMQSQRRLLVVLTPVLAPTQCQRQRPGRKHATGPHLHGGGVIQGCRPGAGGRLRDHDTPVCGDPADRRAALIAHRPVRLPSQPLQARGPRRADEPARGVQDAPGRRQDAGAAAVHRRHDKAVRLQDTEGHAVHAENGLARSRVAEVHHTDAFVRCAQDGAVRHHRAHLQHLVIRRLAPSRHRILL